MRLFLIAAFVVSATMLPFLPLEEAEGCSRKMAPRSPAELEKLLESADFQIRTVLIRGSEDKKSLIEDGFLIMTSEAEYAVVAGQRAQFETLRLPQRAPRESDHKMRRVAVWIDDADEIEAIQRVVSDLWPSSELPGFAEARALDYEVRWLEELGYEVISRESAKR